MNVKAAFKTFLVVLVFLVYVAAVAVAGAVGGFPAAYAVSVGAPMLVLAGLIVVMIYDYFDYGDI